MQQQQQLLAGGVGSGAYGHIPPPGSILSPSNGNTIPTRMGPQMHQTPQQLNYLPNAYEQPLEQNHLEPMAPQGPYPYQLPQMPVPEFNPIHNLPPQEQWEQFNPLQGYQQPYQQQQQQSQPPQQHQTMPQINGNEMPLGQVRIRQTQPGEGFDGESSPQSLGSKKAGRARKLSSSSDSSAKSSAGFKPVSKRSRMGCLTCRQRKKRCCETRPKCTECNRLGLTCVWPKPGTEHKNKPKDLKNEENMIDHQVYGRIKVLRGIVEYKSK